MVFVFKEKEKEKLNALNFNEWYRNSCYTCVWAVIAVAIMRINCRFLFQQTANSRGVSGAQVANALRVHDKEARAIGVPGQQAQGVQRGVPRGEAQGGVRRRGSCRGIGIIEAARQVE
jgi:hypothetical protein